MNRGIHRVYLVTLSLIVLFTLIALIYFGTSYYSVILEERFFHTDHQILKPSGNIGHGLGVVGSLCMIFGVGAYMARKRFRSLSRLGLLKHWLEFHIFLCTLGPIMILFHTSFKFGGLVAISFWSMVAVFISGIIGRFIYIQIPRTIEGREMSLNDIRTAKVDIGETLKNKYRLDEGSFELIERFINQKFNKDSGSVSSPSIDKHHSGNYSLRQIKSLLNENKIPRKDTKRILKLIKDDISLSRKIKRLDTMQKLFKYWHVAHLPFAMVMLIIMIIHIVVTIVFGYRWIF